MRATIRRTIRACGDVSLLDASGGTPLGLLPWAYESASAQLDAGDALFLYTDGVPEANNAEEEEFTSGRVVDVLRNVAQLSSREMMTP